MQKPERCLVAAALLAASVSGATADVIKYGDYYEDKVVRSCPSDFSCRLDFNRTPKSRYLTVRRLSCYIESSQPLRIVALGRTAAAGGLTNSSISIPFVANTTGNGTYYYSINQEIGYKTPPAFYILMSVETSAPSSKYIACSLQGALAKE